MYILWKIAIVKYIELCTFKKLCFFFFLRNKNYVCWMYKIAYIDYILWNIEWYQMFTCLKIVYMGYTKLHLIFQKLYTLVIHNWVHPSKKKKKNYVSLFTHNYIEKLYNIIKNVDNNIV